MAPGNIAPVYLTGLHYRTIKDLYEIISEDGNIHEVH